MNVFVLFIQLKLRITVAWKLVNVRVPGSGAIRPWTIAEIKMAKAVMRIVVD
jgi:hypothetical protein